MLKIVLTGAVALALLTGGAAAGYLSTEYKDAPADEIVVLDAGGNWRVYMHKQHPKMLLTSIAGPMPAAAFKAVAADYLKANRPGCRINAGVPIETASYEFGFACRGKRA